MPILGRMVTQVKFVTS